MQKCTPMGLDPPKSDKSDPVQVVGRELHFWSAVGLESKKKVCPLPV